MRVSHAVTVLHRESSPCVLIRSHSAWVDCVSVHDITHTTTVPLSPPLRALSALLLLLLSPLLLLQQAVVGCCHAAAAGGGQHG